MSELIKSQVQLAQEEICHITGSKVADNRAFSHVILKYCFGVNYIDQIGQVTDGPNDGGIDFLYYDEEDAKVVICQSKYTGTLSFEDVVSELNKMYSTVQNFKKSNTGIYNETLKAALQNAIDRLPEENPDNFEYNIFTIAPLDVEQAYKKIINSNPEFPIDSLTIFTEGEIDKAIQKVQETLDTVPEAKVHIDKARNYLEYESNESKGIMCNVLSTSIAKLYNKYAASGLFDLNIRRYIRNTLVDSGIKKTLDTDRSNFWFLNNGIIIACEEFDIDGDTIKLYDFSIVNGGQTTTLIGNYKGTNTQEFYIPCKIVSTKKKGKGDIFFTKIAEATNSQKPIYARDLKSNAPEMVRLSNWLKDEGIYLEIKRGLKSSFKPSYQIKNDELGQLILSFALQRPGTSRSGKKVIFENQATYDQIFKVNYANDPLKKKFIVDLIRLHDRYLNVEKRLKTSNLDPSQMEILKNGKQAIIAVLGMCYRLANDDIKESDILESPKSLNSIRFEYGPILSSYKEDDIDERFEQVVRRIIKVLSEAYKSACAQKTTTSVSNFLKTDQKYYNEIATYVIDSFEYGAGEDLKNNIFILKR